MWCAPLVSFQVHCGGVQRQNDEDCLNVLINMDLTVIDYRTLFAGGYIVAILVIFVDL